MLDPEVFFWYNINNSVLHVILHLAARGLEKRRTDRDPNVINALPRQRLTLSYIEHELDPDNYQCHSPSRQYDVHTQARITHRVSRY